MNARILPRALLAAVLAAVVAGTSGRAGAEDIDIYAGGGSTGGVANILIAIDNSANWTATISGSTPCYYVDGGVQTSSGPTAKEQGTKGGVEKCALYNLIDSLPVSSTGAALFNVGFMMINTSTAKINGGYPHKALTPITATSKAVLKALIAGLDIQNADKANNAVWTLLLDESWRYLNQASAYAGQSGVASLTGAPGTWDPTAFGLGGHYATPAGSGACGRNYVILIGNGAPQSPSYDSGTTAQPYKDLVKAGGSTTELTPNTFTKSVINSDTDEFGHFMFSSQNTVVHGIAVTGAASDGQFPGFVNIIATRSGGNYYAASDAATLTKDLQAIFADVQAVSSVFTSPALPVAVNSRGTYLNQVFMGMFVPDANAKPRWSGNLKQYAFAFDPTTQNLSLVDQHGAAAVSVTTGFIAPTASSFWTTASSYWINAPAGTPLSSSDDPDGAIVPKGAAAEVLRSAYLTSQSSRPVYTCVSCPTGSALGSSSSTLFTTANTQLTTSLLNATSSAERDLIINWARGTDNKSPSDENGPGGTTTVRPSIMGDVLHSRPAVVNYGGSTGVVVFFGGNDGMLHAVSGAQTGAGAGQELWAFVAAEGLGKLKRLRDNSPLVAYPTTPTSLGAARRDYFVDGPITFYEHVSSGGGVDKVYLYVTLRRGGRSLYAFDVTVPSQPTFLWRVSNADIPQLGQTWSDARVVRVKGYSNPVLVMGAGYDATSEDAQPAASDSMGNAVLVLDAFNGNLIRSFPTGRAVPAAVSVVDSDGDGYVDRGYVGDLGGTVYRLDFEVGSNAQSSAWTITTLASLGSSGAQKFFFPPDVVLTKKYTVVLLGSGDREKPLATSSSDYFFTLLDPNLGKGMPDGWTPITYGSLAPETAYGQGTYQGCYIAMDTAGEKVINGALTIGGVTYFDTNEPAPVSTTSCTANLGVAKAYAVPLLCQPPTTTVLNGGGLAPSPVGGFVQVTYTDATGQQVTRAEPFVIGAGTQNSPIQASKVNIAVPPKRHRKYWVDESAP